MTQWTAEELLELRRKLNLNQHEFWSRLGVRQVTGSRYELSQRRVQAFMQSLITIAYGTKNESAQEVRRLRDYEPIEKRERALPSLTTGSPVAPATKATRK